MRQGSVGPFTATFPDFLNGILTWYIDTWTTMQYVSLQEPESIFVLIFQSEQQKKQQEAEKQHRQERKTLRRSANHLKSKRGRGRLFHWFILCYFFKKLTSFFIWKRNSFKLGHSTNVFVFWFTDEHKNQNLLNPVLITEKFMKLKVLTKGHYKHGVL